MAKTTKRERPNATLCCTPDDKRMLRELRKRTRIEGTGDLLRFALNVALRELRAQQDPAQEITS